jgi:hypothetical protein
MKVSGRLRHGENSPKYGNIIILKAIFDVAKGRILLILVFEKGHAVAHWLRHCATNRNVAGSIPDGVTGIFL